jgi:NAD(P)-dependent dehydrogenase (short-subunit alcohol dehydrogenase family)
LNETTVLVTGAAGSLGAALSLLSLGEGFNTIMLDSNRRGLEALYDQACEAGLPEPVLHPLDLSTAGTEQFEELTEAIAAEFGGLDGVVHCAARFTGLTPLEHVSPPEWLLHMQVNLNAPWLLSVHCLPLLRASRAGHLYFVLEDMESVGGPLWGPYGVSKHALRVMAEQFAAECGSSGVQVLGINTGPFRSPLRAQAFIAENPASQAPPEEAARRIMDLLKGKRPASGAFVDLAASSGSEDG